MSGGSCAPIENAPPGIHVMPWGAFAGAGVSLGRVGVNNGPLETVIAAESTGGANFEITGSGGATMPADAVCAVESFQAVPPDIARIEKTTRVHGRTLYSLEEDMSVSL